MRSLHPGLRRQCAREGRRLIPRVPQGGRAVLFELPALPRGVRAGCRHVQRRRVSQRAVHGRGIDAQKRTLPRG